MCLTSLGESEFFQLVKRKDFKVETLTKGRARQNERESEGDREREVKMAPLSQNKGKRTKMPTYLRFM